MSGVLSRLTLPGDTMDKKEAHFLERTILTMSLGKGVPGASVDVRCVIQTDFTR